MSESSAQQQATASEGGKTYGYQAPHESYEDGSIEDEKEAVVSAFDHFLDALAERAGFGHGGGTTATKPSGTTTTGSASGTSSSASSTGTTGSSTSGAVSGLSSTSSGGSTGHWGSGTATTGMSSSHGTTSGSASTAATSGDGATTATEAHEMSIFAQREAFRLDRARENAKPRQMRPTEHAPGVAPVQKNMHQSDSNRAPITASKEFAPAFGSRGKPEKATKERISVPPAKRPETAAAAAAATHGVRPIDAYWGSFGTAVERAAERARLSFKVLEAIIGTDERTRVTDTSSYPWRCICSLLITASTGVLYVGTAWLVAPRVLLTAGHCVYMSDEGGWVQEIEVIPGRDADERPFGSVTARDFRSVTGWTQDGDSNYDYGAILLPEDKRYGDDLGWFGYANRDDGYLQGITVNISGYPADGGPPPSVDGSQWFDFRNVANVQERQITYEADTFGGDSGAPVFETTSTGERYGVAVHTFGTTVHNGGTRITGDVFDNIVMWAGQAP